VAPSPQFEADCAWMPRNSNGLADVGLKMGLCLAI
jgi:hypothetical protein